MSASKRTPARGSAGEPGMEPEAGRDWRAAYVSHPYLWASIPIVIGLAAAAVAVWRRHVFGYVVGVSIAGFGVMIEALNVADSIWRAAHRRRVGTATGKGGGPPAGRRPSG